MRGALDAQRAVVGKGLPDADWHSAGRPIVKTQNDLKQPGLFVSLVGVPPAVIARDK
jgi:hypothetical protein